MEVKFGEQEIKALIQKLRIFNKDIGTYAMHALTEDFQYIVKLSNGKIMLKVDDLIADSKELLEPDQLIEISSRFRNDEEVNPDSDNQKERKSVTPPKVKSGKKGSKVLKRVIYTVIITLAILAVLVFGEDEIRDLFNTGSDSTGSSYIEQIMTVEEIESANPLSFLDAHGTYKSNFWDTKYTIQCTVTNDATVVSYKDVVVRVIFYSKTKTELGSEDFTLYEVFSPTSSKTL